MRKAVAGVLILVAVAIVGFAVLAVVNLRSPASNVGAGAEAEKIDVNAHRCSSQDAEQCECERTAIASGLSAEAARAACAP